MANLNIAMTTITFRRTRQVKEYESATIEISTTVYKRPEDVSADIEKLELIVDAELDDYISKNKPKDISGEVNLDE
jgi:hypothetical protein